MDFALIRAKILDFGAFGRFVVYCINQTKMGRKMKDFRRCKILLTFWIVALYIFGFMLLKINNLENEIFAL